MKWLVSVWNAKLGQCQSQSAISLTWHKKKIEIFENILLFFLQVFLPTDPEYTWMLAKMFYNNAECSLHQACTHLGLSVNQKPCFIATYKAHSTKLVNTLRAHSTKLVNTCCHCRKNLRKHLWMNFNVA